MDPTPIISLSQAAIQWLAKLIDRVFKTKNEDDRTTVIGIIFGLALSGVFAYGALTSDDLLGLRQKPSTYTEQLDRLNHMEGTLQDLKTFVAQERKNLEQSEKLLDDLRFEHETLQPIVSMDRSAVDALFALQNRRAQEAISWERWIGFAMGVVSSIIASLLITGVRLLLRKRRPTSVSPDDVIIDS